MNLIINAINFLFGGGITLITWYLIMVALDIVTGYIKGLRSHSWKSAINLQGLLIKFATFATVIVSAMIDDIAPILGVNIPINVALAWTALLIIYEGFSILENYKELGGKGFDFLAKYLDVVQQKLKNKGEDE